MLSMQALLSERPMSASRPISASRPVSTNLSVRNLEPETIGRLKRRAAAHGRSAEAELREILRTALAGEAEPGFADLAAELRALTAGRHHTPSETLRREIRDGH